MEFSLTTPALLFPAISLLLLAYTNRFLALAALIRNLHARYQDAPEPLLRAQIEALRTRVKLIRDMQTLGVSGLFCCVFCMLLLFVGKLVAGKFVFAVALLLLLASLGLSIREIQISVNALNLQLSDLDVEEKDNQAPRRWRNVERSENDAA